MARRSQQAFAKRQREMRKAEKAIQKRERRAERKESGTEPVEEAPGLGEDDCAPLETGLPDPAIPNPEP